MPKTRHILVYTDGSCENNGKAKPVGGIGIHFPNGELRDISKPFTREKCTNQTAELYAILVAIRYIKQKIGLENVSIEIRTDSSYSIGACSVWTPAWIQNGWVTKAKKPVCNKELIYPIFKYQRKYPITFTHVKGHTTGDSADTLGNNAADLLARKGTKQSRLLNASHPETRSSGSRTSARPSGSKSSARAENSPKKKEDTRRKPHSKETSPGTEPSKSSRSSSKSTRTTPKSTRTTPKSSRSTPKSSRSSSKSSRSTPKSSRSSSKSPAPSKSSRSSFRIRPGQEEDSSGVFYDQSGKLFSVELVDKKTR